MSAQGVKVCRKRFAGPEVRARLWLRETKLSTIVERLTAVSVIESQAQRIFTLKKGRMNQIRERIIGGQNLLVKNCRISEKRIWKRIEARDRDKKIENPKEDRPVLEGTRSRLRLEPQSAGGIWQRAQPV